MAHRPHTATVRLTEAQQRLAKEKMAHDRGMTWQKLLSAAVNAYVRGDFEVTTDGRYTPAKDAPVLSFVDDDDALSLDELEDYAGRTYGVSTPRILGTRELARVAEERTGRRVTARMLRTLVRERFPQEESPGPGTRYRWSHDDPDIVRIIDAIAAGALDEIAQRGIRAASPSDT